MAAVRANHQVRSFLLAVAFAHGRSPAQLRAIVGCSRATIKRHLATARELGCDIACDRVTGRYVMRNPGPFDVQALRRKSWMPVEGLRRAA